MGWQGKPEPRSYEQRLADLEKDSHPPKPTLDPDDTQRVIDRLERRIATLETRLDRFQQRDALY